jgi:Flp pilus assembly protein TadG
MFRKIIGKEDGSVLVLSAFLIPVIIALGGLLIDFGRVSAEKSQLSGAIDSAAWAALDSYDRDLWDNFGISELTEPQASQLANQYLKKNMPQATLTRVEINGNQVEVEGESVTTLIFMKLFGINEVKVKASAKAKIG